MEEKSEARDVSNEDLTELALDAAIVLDRRLQGLAVDAAVVATFLDAIDVIVDVSQENKAGMLVSDPRQVGVVYRAFVKYGQKRASTIPELLSNIRGLSGDYRKNSESKDVIKGLRDFCIALHKELVAHTMLIRL